MSRIVKHTKGLIKGVPVAVLFSIGVHAAILLVAGGFVVFSVIKKQEKKFEPPPPVERPKMELKKPKVKVKKRARPKASQRITSKSVQNMSSVQLPDVPALGEGLGGGVGGFELMPNVDDISMFGADKSVAVGNDFEGTFFSLAYDNMGQETGLNRTGIMRVIRQFHENGWNVRTFAPYYKSPLKLYTTHFVIPPFLSVLGPSSFGVHDWDFNSVDWVVYYKGKIASRTTGKFRFWGTGDELLIVRLDGEIVFNGTWYTLHEDALRWGYSNELDRKYSMGNNYSWVGPWFELKSEEPVVMEVLLEENGGQGNFMLAVQEEGVYYPKNEEGMMILPAFKTAEFSESVRSQIEYTLIPGDIDLDSDLMFNVY